MIKIINEENKDAKKLASLALTLTAFILGVVCGMQIVLFLLNTYA